MSISKVVLNVFKTLPVLALVVVALMRVNGEGSVASAHTISTALLVAQHSNKCVYHAGGTGNGGSIIQWNCLDLQNQRVQISSAGTGWHYIKFLHSNRCLTVNGWGNYNGAVLDQWDCLGQDNQKWSGTFSNGLFEVHQAKHTVDAGTPRCITVNQQSQADGATINLWSCLGQSNQKFNTANGQNAGATTPYTSFGGYSYTTSSCSTWTDPIGTIFVQGSSSDINLPYQHAQAHGGWDFPGFPFGESTQYYKSFNFPCNPQGGQAASNDGVCESRYHMRWLYGLTTSLGHSFAATPHYDTWSGTCAPPISYGSHCIAPGGFAQARNNIRTNWVVSGPHDLVASVWWGNTNIRLGCNSQQVSGDGWVDYISLQH